MKPPKKITEPELADAARPALLSMPKKARPSRQARADHKRGWKLTKRGVFMEFADLCM